MIVHPSRLAPDVPTELGDLVMRGLARDPAERPESARAMAIAIESIVRPALPREVGEWVERIAAESLSKRRAAMAAIEETVRLGPRPSSSSSVRASTGTTPRAEPLPSLATMTDVRDDAPGNPPAGTELGETTATVSTATKDLAGNAARRSRSRAVAIGGALALLLPIAGAAIVVRSARPTSTPSPAAIVPEALSAGTVAPEAVDPAPPPTSVASSALVEAASTEQAPTTTPATKHGAPSRSRPPTKTRCDPPYYLDAKGIRRIKSGCI